jgi:hypothetical protein
MNFTLKEIAAFFKNLETQEFTGPFGPDWTIRQFAFKQGVKWKEMQLRNLTNDKESDRS